MAKKTFSPATKRIISVQIISCVVLIALTAILVLFLTQSANTKARAVALTNAEDTMRLSVDNIINRIQYLNDEKSASFQQEIGHTLLILANSDTDPVSYVQNVGLFPDDNAATADPFVEIDGADGTPVYQSGSVSAHADGVLFLQSAAIGGYQVYAYTTQDALDQVVQSAIHNEVHQTRYGKNQYVWVNEVINYKGGDHYAIRRIHPNLPDTEGMFLSTSMKDAAGSTPYLSELEGINKDGEIFQSYYFKNLSDDQIAEKYSYAKLYKPYNWIIATGIPMADLYAVPNTQLQQSQAFAIAIIAGVSIIILMILWVGILFVRRDDQLQQARETAQATLLSGVSHDMRTPMNAIINYSGPELTDGCNEAELRENLARINASGRHLMHLINDLLTASKMRNTHYEFQCEPVALRDCFGLVADMVLPLTGEKKQTFTIEYAPGLDTGTSICTDVERLRQILVNLVNNAVKYTPEGGAIRCAVAGTPSPDGRTLALTIRVSDNGIGIPEDKLTTIFKPYSQLDASHSEGIGLGLAIVRELVTAMKGTIQVESTPGQGTTFTLGFDFEIAPGGPAPKAEAESPDVDFTGKRVLVFEDNALNTAIIRRLLEMKGMVCDCAENGRAGLGLFRESPPGTYDLILMDIRMPVMDGLSATRAIRALDRPDVRDLPIIALTADALPQEVSAYKQAGLDGTIAKPIDPPQLYLTLKRCLA